MRPAAIAILAAAFSIAVAGESGASAPRFKANPRLAGIPEKTARLVCQGHGGDRGVLAYSAIVYDRYRHKLLAFGGGHATSFPTSVHEFDLDALKWQEISPDVPRSEFTKANAVMDKDGKPLAGVKWNGKLHASSRHTYDGLVMASEQCLMLVVGGVGNAGYSSKLDNKIFRECYTGRGLWKFDPVKREWSVSKANGLAGSHVSSAIWPREPDWVYIKGKDFRAVNWKTEEVRKLERPPKGWVSLTGLEYYPEEEALVGFPKGSKKAPQNKLMLKYSLAAKKWSTTEVKGDAPGTHDVGTVYDPRSKVFVCCSGGYFYYYSPRENRWYKASGEVAEGLTEGGTVKHRHDYDPVNNVHIVVGGRWKTVAFKLSDQPGKLPGTAGNGN
ncbi:MAG: Kelch repeat-containing protein [Planctomycetota bacterium]